MMGKLILVVVTLVLMEQLHGTHCRKSVRWCKSKTRECARLRFDKLVKQRLGLPYGPAVPVPFKNGSSNTGDTTSGTGGPEVPHTTTGATVSEEVTITTTETTIGPGRRKRDYSSSGFAAKVVMSDSPSSHPRFLHRDIRSAKAEGDEAATAAPVSEATAASAATVTTVATTATGDAAAVATQGSGTATDPATTKAGGDNAGGTATATTVFTPSAEKPSMTLETLPPYRPEEMEDAFFSCLDELGSDNCMLYMLQRCNWHDGSSTVISKYCSRWKLPCLPCSNRHW